MFPLLFLLFVMLPLAEIVLILMLLRIDWMLTLLVALVTGLVGAWYVRRQGTQVLQQMRQSLNQNQVPTNILIEAVLIVIAGALLITPGLITDFIGLTMLIKPCRRWYRKRFIAWLKQKITVKSFTMGQRPQDPDVVDASVVGRRSTGESNADNVESLADTKGI